ncbi:MAG: hypothetical protein JW918_08120 [Anaerolineae bacterium]|nr:hypothetical protein [Anaerolineae bacterium]
MKHWHRLWEKHHAGMTAIASGILVVTCYGFALQLPFFFDDLPVMTWLGHHSIADIWTRSSEGSYFRPLAFSIYKFGLSFPFGVRQVVLHAVNLLIYWLNAILISRLVKVRGKGPGQALLTSALYAVFPFMFLAVPWITALPHHLVTMLTLLATYAALRAARDGIMQWWGISLTATLLAPFAHESGVMCSAIVGSLVILQYGLCQSRRHLSAIALGGALNVSAVLLRSQLPGVNNVSLEGLGDWLQNIMFFLHGLTYPAAPLIGWLVRTRGWQDFTLIAVATAILIAILLGLALRRREWRWIAGCLWWWGCAALPVSISFRYGALYIAPRFYALASVGIVALWAYVAFEAGKLLRTRWGQWLIWALLAGTILTQSIAFLYRQRALFLKLNDVYEVVLAAAKDEEDAPLGFVNLPSSLAWPEKTHALIRETVVFIPPYSNIREFVGVNRNPWEAQAVMCPPVLQAAEQIYGFQGEGIGWEEMRQFAIDHRSVWLTRYYEGEIVLLHVGAITANATPSTAPFVRFTGGPVIESASVQKAQDGWWAVAITWIATGPVDAEIFVHVQDADGNLVTQADGPALGGMVPLWLWQAGDRIHDVRYFTVSEDVKTPLTVRVGIYNKYGRFPAFIDSTSNPDDAATIATLTP